MRDALAAQPAASDRALARLARRFDRADIDRTSVLGRTWSELERRGGSQAASCEGFATPLVLTPGLTDLTVAASPLLDLTDDDARSLCAACEEALAGEGVRLAVSTPTLWRVRVAEPIAVACERPDWLAGRSLRPLLPQGADARRLERWMNALQMQLHAHPVNTARARQAMPHVNGVWLWGFDGLPAQPGAGVVTAFAEAWRRNDASAWSDAWQRVAATLGEREVAWVLGDHEPRLALYVRASDWFGWFRDLIAKVSGGPSFAQVLERFCEVETL